MRSTKPELDVNMLAILGAIRSTPATNIDQELYDSFGNKTCAVVGSAGSLLGHEYGHIIDKHDIIIRCNQAATEKYENHVGSRTDIRIMNSHYFTALKGEAPPSHSRFLPEMKKQFPLFDENLLYSLKNEMIIVKHGVSSGLFSEEIQKIEKENNTVKFMNADYYNMASHVVGTHATNGIVAIFFALKYFSSVSCFGFTFCKEMRTTDWDKLYYFMPALPPKNWKETSCHSNQNESKIIDRMSELDLLKFYGC